MDIGQWTAPCTCTILLYIIKSNFACGSNVPGDMVLEHSQSEEVHKTKYGL